jgi:hypothetical protein
MTQHSIKTTSISKHLHRYADELIALSPDYRSVVARSVRLQQMIASLPTTDRARVVYRKVLPIDADYAPGCIAEACGNVAVQLLKDMTFWNTIHL